jgi:hypothetical protein
MRGKSQWMRAALACCVVFGASAASHAASITYGNFGPNASGLTFLGVTESSATDPVPLFGPPSLTLSGLDFNPTSFVSAASGGSLDITDGQLNFSIHGSNPIQSIAITEAGDYSLTGVGTAQTTALAGAILRITVTEINGVAVAPIALAPTNASVGFNLVANPGIVQPWSLGITSNLSFQQFPGAANVTGVDVVIDNQLNTISQAASLAFIAKKDFTVVVTSTPEPASLAAGALLTVILRRRR